MIGAWLIHNLDTWLRSLKIDADFVGVPFEVTRRIIDENAGQALSHRAERGHRSILDEIDRSMLDENRTIFGSMHLTTSFLASVKIFER
jgi:hypothetical protein